MPSGRWETFENSIEEVRPNATRFVRFSTVSAAETPAAMEELHERFDRAMRSAHLEDAREDARRRVDRADRHRNERALFATASVRPREKDSVRERVLTPAGRS